MKTLHCRVVFIQRHSNAKIIEYSNDLMTKVSLDGGTFVQYQAEEKEVDEVGHLSVVSIISESIKLMPLSPV